MEDFFFITSKLAWGLLSPSALYLWLILLATVLLLLNYISAAKKLFLFLGVVGFAMLVFPVSDYLMYPLETRFSAPENNVQNIDGIIVLGGAEKLKVSEDWQTPQVGQGAERILTAAKLARMYPQAPVIYTGGSNLVQMQNLDREGKVSTQLLKQAGLPNSRLILESRARNTYENFVLIRPLLPVPDGRYLLITSAYHMPRAVGVARHLGVNVVPYPVDYRSNSPAFRYIDFDLYEHIKVLEPAWHEWIGLTAYYLSGKTASWFPAESQN